MEAATPSACSLTRRAVSEMSALQGWWLGEGMHEGRGSGTWTAVNERVHQQLSCLLQVCVGSERGNYSVQLQKRERAPSP